MTPTEDGGGPRPVPPVRDARGKYRYADHTWPEIKQAIAMEKVVLLPVGSVEDHGYHLPMDTDHFSEHISLEAGRRRPDLFVVMPIVAYGFNLHHLDWPGTIHIRSEHLIDFTLDITKSLAHHGFRKIVLVNGHGSNMPCLDLAARRTVLETDALCAALMWTSLAAEAIAEVRETPFPGVAHAEEIETSLYLHLAPERVQMERAVPEFPEEYARSKFVWQDLQRPSPVMLMDWWSRFDRSGVIGDPTLASAEKGRRLWEAAVQGLIDFGLEFKGWPLKSRRDYHDGPAGSVRLEG